MLKVRRMTYVDEIFHRGANKLYPASGPLSYFLSCPEAMIYNIASLTSFIP